jgi:cation:H+ antiporter
MIFAYIGIFILSIVILYWSGSRLINSLVKVCQFLEWREFVVAFFIMAIATSLTNLFVDLNAAFQGIPQLALGDIMGGNIVDLTLVVGLAVLFGNINLPAESRMVQKSALFTLIITILPLILILDGRLDRIDGVVLLLAFLIYAWWLFGKKERFTKVYKSEKNRKIKIKPKEFLKGLGGAIVFSAFLLLASEGVILSAQQFSNYFNMALPLVGILIVGLGNCAPETYFAIISARRNNNWMILGNLMGSVIICSTLVLGIVALIAPIQVHDFSPFAIARAFLVVSALFFVLVLKTGHTITKKEGFFLIIVYFLFLISELFFRQAPILWNF